MALHERHRSNHNFYWGGLLAETLRQLGVTLAVICPGSRSAPLATGFALCDGMEAVPVLDERSAAFFAIGHARRTRRPAALVCTSGTAAANFLPAVVEAHESRLPLLLLTADRPPELRNCAAGQAIDQQKLFGNYVRWFHEMALPDTNLLPYLGNTLQHAVTCALGAPAGPVQLNCPFREPLIPEPDPDFTAPPPPEARQPMAARTSQSEAALATAQAWARASRKPVIIAGQTDVAVAENYTTERLPRMVLTDCLSDLRHHDAGPIRLPYYDVWLREHAVECDLAVCIGQLPTSKALRQWLATTQCRYLHVDTDPRIPLPSGNPYLSVSPDDLFAQITFNAEARQSPQWHAACEAGKQLHQRIRELDTLCEPKLPQLLADNLPVGTAIFLASSTPVRDAEWFWPSTDRRYKVSANRGANGIDGTLSSAMGLAHRSGTPTVLVTGDLAFLHDSGGLLLKLSFEGSLTIIVINNNGGGIFQNLPIAQYEAVFERYFATPQQVDLARLADAHGINYALITSCDVLAKHLQELPDRGLQILEVPTDRQADARLRKTLLQLPQ